LYPRETIFARCDETLFDGWAAWAWADPESYAVMKRKTCFFPGWVGCTSINILMVSQFNPHFPARPGWKGDETHFHHVQTFSKNRISTLAITNG
jgi:hypothetical protein